ncbi:MAG: hypothetical protein RL088_1362 [Verrucomicrobiota bacterium]
MAYYDDPNVFYDADVFYDSEESPTKNKKMARILRNWSRLSRQARVNAGKLVATKLDGNANVPNPMPTVAALNTAVDAAQALITEVAEDEQALAEKRSQRDAAIDLVVKLLGQEASTVEGATAGDPTKILSAGFEIAEVVGAPVGVLPAPQDLRSTAGDNEGSLDDSCDAVPGAATYEWQTTANPNDPNSWVTRATTTKSSVTITDLPSGTRMYSRVRAHGAAGPGAWSDVAVKMVP